MDATSVKAARAAAVAASIRRIRIIEAGQGVTRAALEAIKAELMALAAASALAARTADARVQSAIIAGWVVAYAILFIAIERHSRLAPR